MNNITSDMISDFTTIKTAYKIFENHPELTSVSIVDGELETDDGDIFLGCDFKINDLLFRGFLCYEQIQDQRKYDDLSADDEISDEFPTWLTQEEVDSLYDLCRLECGNDEGEVNNFSITKQIIEGSISQIRTAVSEILAW